MKGDALSASRPPQHASGVSSGDRLLVLFHERRSTVAAAVSNSRLLRSVRQFGIGCDEHRRGGILSSAQQQKSVRRRLSDVRTSGSLERCSREHVPQNAPVYDVFRG